jgi:hypothetical protein
VTTAAAWTEKIDSIGLRDYIIPITTPFTPDLEVDVDMGHIGTFEQAFSGPTDDRS